MSEEKWFWIVSIGIIAAVIYAAYCYEYHKEISLWRSIIVRQDKKFQYVTFKTQRQIWDALVELNDPMLIASYVASHQSDFGESPMTYYRSYYHGRYHG